MKDQTQNDLIRCVGMTLAGSSVIAIGTIAAMLAGGVSVEVIERIMVQAAVPWFVFWNLFCRYTHNIKIEIVQEDQTDDRE